MREKSDGPSVKARFVDDTQMSALVVSWATRFGALAVTILKTKLIRTVTASEGAARRPLLLFSSFRLYRALGRRPFRHSET